MAIKRRRFKQTLSLSARLISYAAELNKEASKLPAGQERDLALRRLRQADTALHINDWINSRGLKPPTD